MAFLAQHISFNTVVHVCVYVCVVVCSLVDSGGPDGRGSTGVDQRFCTQFVIPSVGVANPQWGRGCTDSIPDILKVGLVEAQAA